MAAKGHDRDQGALQGGAGAALEVGQAGGGMFTGGRSRPEFHREIDTGSQMWQQEVLYGWGGAVETGI